MWLYLRTADTQRVSNGILRELTSHVATRALGSGQQSSLSRTMEGKGSRAPLGGRGQRPGSDGAVNCMALRGAQPQQPSRLRTSLTPSGKWMLAGLNFLITPSHASSPPGYWTWAGHLLVWGYPELTPYFRGQPPISSGNPPLSRSALGGLLTLTTTPCSTSRGQFLTSSSQLQGLVLGRTQELAPANESQPHSLLAIGEPDWT